MDKYTFDKCSICGEHKALKNNVCAECNNNIELPFFFEELFKKGE